MSCVPTVMTFLLLASNSMLENELAQAKQSLISYPGAYIETVTRIAGPATVTHTHTSTVVSTTIGGHATVVSVSITEHASTPADTTPTPSKTRHALGSASYTHADVRTSLCVALLSIFLVSSGAFLIFW